MQVQLEPPEILDVTASQELQVPLEELVPLVLLEHLEDKVAPVQLVQLVEQDLLDSQDLPEEVDLLEEMEALVQLDPLDLVETLEELDLLVCS